MSNFRDAYHAMLSDQAMCPRCDARNLTPPASPTIEIDFEHDAAVCLQCGHGGPLSSFLPKESHDAAP